MAPHRLVIGTALCWTLQRVHADDFTVYPQFLYKKSDYSEPQAIEKYEEELSIWARKTDSIKRENKRKASESISEDDEEDAVLDKSAKGKGKANRSEADQSTTSLSSDLKQTLSFPPKIKRPIPHPLSTAIRMQDPPPPIIWFIHRICTPPEDTDDEESQKLIESYQAYAKDLVKYHQFTLNLPSSDINHYTLIISIWTGPGNSSIAQIKPQPGLRLENQLAYGFQVAKEHGVSMVLEVGVSSVSNLRFFGEILALVRNVVVELDPKEERVFVLDPAAYRTAIKEVLPVIQSSEILKSIKGFEGEASIDDWNQANSIITATSLFFQSLPVRTDEELIAVRKGLCCWSRGVRSWGSNLGIAGGAYRWVQALEHTLLNRRSIIRSGPPLPLDNNTETLRQVIKMMRTDPGAPQPITSLQHYTIIFPPPNDFTQTARSSSVFARNSLPAQLTAPPLFSTSASTTLASAIIDTPPPAFDADGNSLVKLTPPEINLSKAAGLGAARSRALGGVLKEVAKSIDCKGIDKSNMVFGWLEVDRVEANYLVLIPLRWRDSDSDFLKLGPFKVPLPFNATKYIRPRDRLELELLPVIRNRKSFWLITRFNAAQSWTGIERQSPSLAALQSTALTLLTRSIRKSKDKDMYQLDDAGNRIAVFDMKKANLEELQLLAAQKLIRILEMERDERD